MNYLSPVYVTLGAALFLGETLAMRRLVFWGSGRGDDYPAPRVQRGQ